MNELQIEENKIVKNKTIIKKNKISLITNKTFSLIKEIRKRNYNFLKKNLNVSYFDLKIKQSNTPLFFFSKFSNKLKEINLETYSNQKKYFVQFFGISKIIIFKISNFSFI